MRGPAKSKAALSARVRTGRKSSAKSALARPMKNLSADLLNFHLIVNPRIGGINAAPNGVFDAK
jgi:hypothetical protein